LTELLPAELLRAANHLGGLRVRHGLRVLALLPEQVRAEDRVENLMKAPVLPLE
jgi:hypothetical protein